MANVEIGFIRTNTTRSIMEVFLGIPVSLYNVTVAMNLICVRAY